ncbi:acetolactate synthase large subunit [Luteimonas sp. MC1750]|uniref:acetolactate synthase large subunit n=1 Tax=Luteimonas sp. MC1750 TaxID=2799326 RepID=UPI0018F0E926|nr:acetolactate synthase large subunit [Luteimonas sp. MC1750]MBJ6983172.1 acetolactate synthase large subunit [Luteimonas sp. MC1750]QQO05126.1 acetolactate synthase large subunit [Luteimonas sp. MC1750]
MAKASDLLVAALEAEGVETIFGIPGEENLDLIESLRTSRIRLVLTRHEQAAGFMAATCGRLTGRAGVCLSTLGPGATNLVTAAAYAQLGAMPMLMITGQKPIRSSRQGHFQIIDTIGTLRPLTKYTRQLVSADSIPARVREAFRRAEDERPGATHLELPQDIAGDPTDAVPIARSYSRRPVAEHKAIARAAAAIRDARHPLLMIGAGANRKTTARALRGFVDRLGIPFFSTQMGKGVLDETDPLWIGTAALSDHDYVHRAIDAADCIVNIGHDVIEKPPFFMREGRRTVIHVNYDGAEVDAVYFPQLEVVGDIADAVRRLGESLEPQAHWDFAFFDRVRTALCSQLGERSRDDRFPMASQRIVADLAEALGPDDITCLDNGLYKLWFARNHRCRRPNTLLLDNALATMGAGLPSAIAARIVHPDRKVVAVCGDGGFMMNSQELETAVRLQLDLVVLVLRDDAYGMIKWKQAHEDFPDYGMDLGNPDFVKYAESYGARGHRPASAAGLLPLLREALATPGVDLIEVPVDYADDDWLLNEEIPRLSAAVE